MKWSKLNDRWWFNFKRCAGCAFKKTQQIEVEWFLKLCCVQLKSTSLHTGRCRVACGICRDLIGSSPQLVELAENSEHHKWQWSFEIQQKMSIVYFDLETTGFQQSAEILQIGAIPAGGQQEGFQDFIMPRGPINPNASRINGIYKDQNGRLRDRYGRNIRTNSLTNVLGNFFGWLDSVQCRYLVAHNVNFDWRHLNNSLNSIEHPSGPMHQAIRNIIKIDSQQFVQRRKVSFRKLFPFLKNIFWITLYLNRLAITVIQAARLRSGDLQSTPIKCSWCIRWCLRCPKSLWNGRTTAWIRQFPPLRAWIFATFLKSLVSIWTWK